MTTTSTPALTSKQCVTCSAIKPLTEFYKHVSCKDGLQKRCKPCSKAANKKSKQRLGQEHLDRQQHQIQLRRRYNMTIEQYDELYKKQDGKCAICHTDTCSTGRRLSVDHCHTTGKIRGLLCAHCNTALGKFNDDIERIQRAINYLQSAH